MGVTTGHPMFVAGRGWIAAGELVPGDIIRNADLRELAVLAIEADDTPQRVHNLEIAEAHTYFVGELEAWGHNRTQKSQWHSSRKKAKDAASRFGKPTPKGLSKKQMKKKKKLRTRNDGADAYGPDGHFHDDNHDDKCRTNVHYRWEKKSKK